MLSFYYVCKKNDEFSKPSWYEKDGTILQKLLIILDLPKLKTFNTIRLNMNIVCSFRVKFKVVVFKPNSCRIQTIITRFIGIKPHYVLESSSYDVQSG